MKICSITLSSSRPDTIGDALRSVSSVIDCAIIVDLGLDQPTIDAIHSAIRSDWDSVECSPDSPCAEMRNTGLKYAEFVGFDWAIMLDTDERINLNGVDLKMLLEETDYDCLSIVEDTGMYAKPRIFRLPAHRYHGGIHEQIPYDRIGLVPGATFHELPKTLEVYQARLRQDLEGLQKQIEASPNNPAWEFYLGLTLEALNRPLEAIQWYRRSQEHNPNPRMTEWTSVRIASCYLLEEDRQSAKDELSQYGNPSMAEIPCMLAALELEEGNFRYAIASARLADAIAESDRRGYVDTYQTIRQVEAIWEYPAQIAAAAWAGVAETLRNQRMGK